MSKLGFDEFQALRQRNRKDAAQADVDDGASRKEPPAEEEQQTFINRAGQFVEMVEVQVLVSGLILMDVIASMLELLSSYPDTVTASVLPGAVVRLLQSFTGFTAFLFLLELLVIFAAFGSSVLKHPGYLADFVVVGVCLHSDIFSDSSKELRLLGILRTWRIIRLNGTLVAAVEAELETARRSSYGDKERAALVEAEFQRLEETMRVETISKKRMEQMCRAYKDEVDTLNEALKIAARDIAEAADSELESEEEEEDRSVRAEQQTSKFVVNASGSFSTL
ncbi:hypothetical protein M885DRAFT_530688 [Pelagophyceae sp. CCMP2097]|nr:hypothetical protein M885DRAFT_530688 [Pelagophyceae sp. CCMP2097]